MDRSEYKERIVRIDGLILEGKQEDALDFLDSINWRKLHNVNFLVEGAERYEKLKKFFDAKELLEIAHERSPVGRMIIYRLALLCAKMGEIEEAKSYYQKFIELAPNDNIRFLIKYEISKAQKADDNTLITILEELKANELIEEWAFELACLYRKTGQSEKCVSILDEIILWFGEGPYVEKACEMKMKYVPLTKDQQIRYQRMTTAGEPIVEIHPDEKIAANEFLGHTIRIPEIEESKEKFSTQDLQAEIRKNIEDIMKASEIEEITGNMDAIKELIEDIPNVKIKDEQTSEERRQNTQRLELNLRNRFEAYLSEEFDGQIRLSETGKEEKDDNIDGQMTIEDLLERWAKTKRAAENAINEAREEELAAVKQQAIAQASGVLDMLIENEEIISEGTQKTFKIPRIVASEEVVGEEFEIPIIDMEEPDQTESDREDIREADQLQKGSEDETADREPETDVNNTQEDFEYSAEQALKDINAMLQDEIDKLSKEVEEENVEQVSEEVIETSELPKIDISDFAVEVQTEFSDKEKEILSYFTRISGLEKPILTTLTNMRKAVDVYGPKQEGHLLVTGISGCGKTRLVQNLIKVVQEETGKPEGNVGRIAANKLNEKDVRTLIDKIRGGALIIEKASLLKKDTMVSLTLNMEGDVSGTLIILEDTKSSMDALMNVDYRFAKKFTERIDIPIMSIDELVSFGKIYAAENGFGINEMGILALYDRINVSNLPDNPASISDVKNIVDGAMAVSRNRKFRGLFALFGNKSHEDNEGAMLQERDFRND